MRSYTASTHRNLPRVPQEWASQVCSLPLLDYSFVFSPNGSLGLLPLLKSIHRPIELKKYAGETFGIDGYGWLHRGAIACAVELAQGKPTRK